AAWLRWCSTSRTACTKTLSGNLRRRWLAIDAAEELRPGRRKDQGNVRLTHDLRRPGRGDKADRAATEVVPGNPAAVVGRITCIYPTAESKDRSYAMEAADR